MLTRDYLSITMSILTNANTGNNKMNEVRKELLIILSKIQNKPEYINQDIMSFAGFCNDEELAEYINQKAL